MTALSPHRGLAAPLGGERGDPPASSGVHASAEPPAFEEVYEQLFDFVWRSLRRLGVLPAGIDDAVQDVFVVVHRRLGDYEGRSSLKTWVFGIALRVARDHRRSRRRKGDHEPLDARIPDGAPDPGESLERAEAVRELDRILSTLDDDKREVFVMAEIEQMTAPEIAGTLEINVNTVYSRLRAARRAFEAALAASRGGAP